MNTNGSTTRDTRSIPGPLRTAADMPSRWDDVELGFDEAAERIIQAHAKDGAAQDLPIGDLKTWAIAPQGRRVRARPALASPRAEASPRDSLLEPHDAGRRAVGVHPAAPGALAARDDELLPRGARGLLVGDAPTAR